MNSGIPDPVALITFFIVLGLVPFMAMMVTSFTKIVVVLSLLRNALGLQQVPPNAVLNGLAIILSLYLMYPVVTSIGTAMLEKSGTFSGKPAAATQTLIDAVKDARDPIAKFLMKHSTQRERAFFLKSASLVMPKEDAVTLKETDLIVLIPAFTLSELTEAFMIGFMVFLPFVVIDLIVANVLLALGMAMVSPTVISLPFKLLLFVLLDGWSRLVHALVLSYR